MYSYTPVFAQLMQRLPLYEFRKCVARYKGDYRNRSFFCLDQFYCMAFAQLTYRESLRDITICLNAMPTRLHRMGFRGRISRSTLAYANENRDWRIFADFAQILIRHARKLYAKEDFGVELDSMVYALDSTTIDLCLALFPWAEFRATKAAVKLHTLLDMRGSIPTWIRITTGAVHDVNILDDLIPEPGAFYVMDRGYIDFERLHRLHTHGAFFVTRTKKNTKLRRLYTAKVDKTTGLRCDQTVVLENYYSTQGYPDKLRRIKFYDAEKKRQFVFLTNNFTVPALTIALLYKGRWSVELFFKWIKMHLRIKAFYGTSENAVKVQVWVAISVYVMVAILRKELGTEHSLYSILQILSVSAFEDIQINQLLTNFKEQETNLNHCNQLNLFDF